MQEIDRILSKMEVILDQLIENAKKLYETSQRSPLEDELASLQVRQQELLETLLKLDKAFEKAQAKSPPEKTHCSPWNRVQQKLKIFEELNSSFIKHMSSSHGLIQFESSKVTKKIKDSPDLD